MIAKAQRLKRVSLLTLLLGSTLLACTPKPDVSNSPEVSDSPAASIAIADKAPELNAAQTELQTTNLVQIMPTPDWVEVEPLPEFPEDSLDLIKNGVAYIAKDNQIYVTETGYKYFSRFAYQVTERKGLETAAQIKQTFDPELGSLAYNFVRVIRDGKIVDRLPDLTIQELQREDGLSDGLVDGDITALINLEDIRVGDIIDYGYYSEYQAPLWPGHYFDNVSISYSVPLALQKYEISIDDNTPLSLDVINSKLRPQISKKDQRTTYTYQLKNAAVDKKISNIPEDLITDPYLLISTMQSWQEVSEWGVEVYDLDMTLPKDYSATLKKLKKSAKTPEGRMAAALKQVQNDIRYLGIESGVNSHKPRTPLKTLSNGYGDCKDKTLVLIATLEKLGISAYPALVSTSSGKILPQLLPSINNFNHVIVMAEIDGEIYWLDPTLTYQEGSAETLTVPDYGYVLPLKPGQSDLVEIVITPPEAPTTHVSETYLLAEDGTMSLDVVTLYRQKTADKMRRSMIKDGLEATSKSYLNYYADLYPGLTLNEKMFVTDDKTANLFSIHESYSLSSEDYKTNEIDDKLYVKAITLESQLPASIEADRDIKLGLAKNTHLQHTIIIKTPGRQFVAPKDLIEDAPGVTFSRKYKSENEALYVDYVLKIEEASVPLGDARQVIELADELASQITLNIYPKAAEKKLSARLGLKTAIPEDMETELNEVTSLIQNGKNVEALERLNVLEADYTKADALRGYIQFYRGAVLIDVKRKKAAITAFDEAFSLYDPDKPDIYFHYASLLHGDDQNIKAVKIIDRLLRAYPEAIKKVNFKWLWPVFGDVFRAEEFSVYESAMIATAQAQLDYVDDIAETDQAFESVIPILVRNDQIDAVKPFLPYLKDPSSIRDILIHKEMEKIWPDVSEIASADLSLAIENYVKHKAELAETEDADFKTKIQYLYALYQAGEFEKAKSVGGEDLKNWSKIDAVGMDAYWFVAVYASVLSNMGEKEEANRLFDKLLKDRLADHPELLSLAVNRATMHAFDGEFEAAIKLVETYEADEDFEITDSGWLTLHQARACAMSGKGDKTEALELYSEKTKDIYEENLPVHFLALVCMDQIDDAASILIERLESDLYRETTLPIFTTTNPRKLPSPYEVKLMGKVKAVAARPDVMEVFEKYGRSIHINGPAEYWSEY